MPGEPTKISGSKHSPGKPARTEARRPCQTASMACPIHGMKGRRDLVGFVLGRNTMDWQTAAQGRQTGAIFLAQVVHAGRGMYPLKQSYGPTLDAPTIRLRDHVIGCVQVFLCDLAGSKSASCTSRRMRLRETVHRSSTSRSVAAPAMKVRLWNGIVVVARVMAESFLKASHSPPRGPAPCGGRAIEDERFQNLKNF